MRYRLLFVLIAVFVFTIGTASATDTAWVVSDAVVAGLGGVASYPGPSVFNYSGTLKLINGNGGGTFSGYDWNGAAWVSNATLVTGLGDVVEQSKPSVFYMDGKWNLISGSKNGALSGPFFGYDWNGATWTLNATLITGLPDLGANSAPSVFYKDGVWNLISGGDISDFNAFYWNGAAWVSNTSMVAGLPTTLQYTTPSVYYDYSDNLKLIAGMDNGYFVGYDWNGTSWISNSSLIPFLVDTVTYSAPHIFYDLNGKLKNIVGDSDGHFDGYYWDSVSVPVVVNPSNTSILLDIPVELNVTSTSLYGSTITYYFYGGTSPASMSYLGSSTSHYDWNILAYDVYYWTAYAGVPSLTSSNMTTAYFTLLVAPNLSSPVNTSTIYTTYPPLTSDITFSCQDTGAPQYRLEVAEDEHFNINVIDIHTVTNSSTQTLIVNKQYYWRVYAYDGTTYSDSSDIFNFNLTGNSTLSGSAIEGVVYANGDEYTAISGAEVIIWNATWSDSAITGSNGYYVFPDVADGQVYSLQAKADQYLTSSVAIISATTDPITQNFYLLEDLTDTEWWHYVSFILQSMNGTRYSDVLSTVYIGDAVTPYETGITCDDGAVVFHLDKHTRYRVTFIDSDQGISETRYVYPISNLYNIYISEDDLTFDSENVSTNLTNYTTDYTNRSWSLQNLTSAEINSTIGLGLLGQGIVASIVMWVVVGAGGVGVGFAAVCGLAMLGIITWVMVLFCAMTTVSLYILGSKIQ